MYVFIRGALQGKFVCVHAYYQIMETWHNPQDAFLVQLPQDLFSTEPKKSGRQDITCICFSPSEETMVVSTNKNQLYMFTMFSTKLIRVSAVHIHSFHAQYCNNTGYSVLFSMMHAHKILQMNP